MRDAINPVADAIFAFSSVGGCALSSFRYDCFGWFAYDSTMCQELWHRMVTDVFPGSPSFVPSPASAAPPTNPMRDTWDILGRHVVPKSVNKVIFIRSSVRFPPKKVSSLLISFPCTFSWQHAHGTCLGEWLSAYRARVSERARIVYLRLLQELLRWN